LFQESPTIMRHPSTNLPAAGNRYPRKGAAAVEFAAVALAFSAIILGIFEVGRAFMVRHLLTNAARQACRFGVLDGKSTSQITAVAVNALTAQGISGENVSVQVNDGSTDASAAPSGAEITVIVAVPISSVSWMPIPSYVVNTLSGQYTLRRE
jgi:Flp pilus assembly protein TadG